MSSILYILSKRKNQETKIIVKVKKQGKREKQGKKERKGRDEEENGNGERRNERKM